MAPAGRVCLTKAKPQATQSERAGISPWFGQTTSLYVEIHSKGTSAETLAMTALVPTSSCRLERLLCQGIRSKIFRRRSELPGPRWEYELPEGKIATPAQLAEYRRRCRRIALCQCAIIFGFIPLAVWLDVAFLSDAIIEFLVFIASAMAAGFLMMFAARTFRSPVCD